MSKSRGRQPVFLSGKLKTSDSSLFYLINDEHLSFKELIEDEGFEFEIIGNIHKSKTGRGETMNKRQQKKSVMRNVSKLYDVVF